MATSLFITEDFEYTEFASSNGRFECLETASSSTTFRADGEPKAAVIPCTTSIASPINIPSPLVHQHFLLEAFVVMVAAIIVRLYDEDCVFMS